MPSGVFFSWVHSFSITVNISARYWGAHRKFYEISKNTFFTEHLRTSASEHGYSTGVARIPPTSKMESFARILNGFVIAAKLTILDVFPTPDYTSGRTWTKHEQSISMNKVQQEKIATCEERYRRLMSNENIATCRGATRNSAVPKKNATQKNATWKDYYTKSATWKWCNMKKVQHEKSATWKKCNTKKVQHGKSATWKKCNMRKGQYEKT